MVHSLGPWTQKQKAGCLVHPQTLARNQAAKTGNQCLMPSFPSFFQPDVCPRSLLITVTAPCMCPGLFSKSLPYISRLPGSPRYPKVGELGYCSSLHRQGTCLSNFPKVTEQYYNVEILLSNLLKHQCNFLECLLPAECSAGC